MGDARDAREGQASARLLTQAEYHAREFARPHWTKHNTPDTFDCQECLRQYGVCKRKHRFADFETARIYGDEWNRNCHGERLLAPYKCRVCLHFHLTTAKGAKAKRARYRYRRSLRLESA